MAKIRKALRPIVFVICCLFVAGGAAYPWLAPRFAEAYHKGCAQQALARDDLELAKVHLLRCLQIRSDNAEAHFLLARTCRRQEDVTGWETHLRESRRLGWPRDAIRLEENLGQAQAGLLSAAEPPLLRLLESWHEEEALILEALAKGYLRNYRFKDVLRAGALWQKDYPEDWRPHYYRGQAFEILNGGHDLAVREYQAALTLGPQQPDVHLRLAGVLTIQSRYAEALDHFQVALQCWPHHPGGLFGVAYCQRWLGNSEAACGTLDALLAQDANHAAGLLLRGQLALDLGHHDEALVWLRRAEALNPKVPDLTQTLSQCLGVLGKPDESARYRQEAEQLHAKQERLERTVLETSQKPGDIALRLDAGVLLQGLGRYREAVRWLDSALQLDPSHAPSHAALAECLDKLGQTNLAAMHRLQAQAQGKSAARDPASP
jgi:tetratricopeptide (TPR) repeat protein